MSLNCPHCGKPVQIPTPAFNNAHRYSSNVLTVTNCCGRAVRLRAVTSFAVDVYIGDAKHDDWLNPITPTDPEIKQRFLMTGH